MSLETDTAEKIGKILVHVENHTMMISQINNRFDRLPCEKHSLILQKCSECLAEKQSDKKIIKNMTIKYIGQAVFMTIVSMVTYFFAKKVGS